MPDPPSRLGGVPLEKDLGKVALVGAGPNPIPGAKHQDPAPGFQFRSVQRRRERSRATHGQPAPKDE